MRRFSIFASVLFGTNGSFLLHFSFCCSFGPLLAQRLPVDALLTTAASGLRARLESLDMLANNLANAATTGYKADREFYSTYVAAEAWQGPAGTYPAISPLIQSSYVDYSPGTLLKSSSALDLALLGEGFFAVSAPNGVAYTRNGHFRISTEGLLVNYAGDRVIGDDGQPIRLDPALEVVVDKDGVIRQQGRIVGRLRLVEFADRSALIKAGATYFRYQGDPAGVARASRTQVEQGSLESANFSPAASAVRLVHLLRQFEMLGRAISVGGEMNRRAVEEVARVRE